MRCWTSRAAARILRGDDEGGRVACGDLPGEARAGEDGDLGEAVGPEDLLHDLAHPHERSLLDPLGQADHDLLLSQSGCDPGIDRAAELGGDGDEEDVGRGGGLPEVLRESDALGEREAGEESRVLPGPQELLVDIVLPDPEPRRQADRPRCRAKAEPQLPPPMTAVLMTPSARASVPCRRRGDRCSRRAGGRRGRRWPG